MNFIKKYSSLILPAILVLVALLLFIPTNLISGSIKESLSKSSKSNSEINNLIKKAVPKDQHQQEQLYQDAHEKDVNGVTNIFAQTSKRELLTYSVFPKPTSQSNQIFKIFGESYIKAIENLADQVMNAGDAPSQSYLNSLTTGVGVKQNGENGSKNIIDNACLGKARQVKVYANPETSFLGLNFWKTYEFSSREASIKDCWYSQVAYWIQEDVADTIRQANQGSANVLSSDVKRLLGISFVGEVAEQAGKDSKSISFEKPVYIKSENTAGICEIWTNRKGGDKFDVVHFSLAVIIDVKALPEFYDALCGQKTHSFMGWKGNEPKKEFVRNPITILKESVVPVDVDSEGHKYYRYGNAAVVRLDLVCEYVFVRAGYDKIKPEEILKELGQDAESNTAKNNKSGSSKRNKRSKRRKK